jgi:arabinose-5-phosphate isomerase
LEQCRIAPDTRSVREVFVLASLPGRRTGAIMLVDEVGRLSGIFTDSDLARLFERRRDAALDGPIREVMTCRPTTVLVGSRMVEAVDLMARRKISELPVVDSEGRPAGLIDITDVVGLLPKSPREDDENIGDEQNEPISSLPNCRVFREPEGGGAA